MPLFLGLLREAIAEDHSCKLVSRWNGRGEDGTDIELINCVVDPLVLGNVLYSFLHAVPRQYGDPERAEENPRSTRYTDELRNTLVAWT